MAGKSKARKINILHIIISMPFIGILLLIALFVIWPIYNNIKLEFFANQVFDYPLPPSSKVISMKKDIGNLCGSGNHCDFWAIMIISSNLSEVEIENHYKKLKICPAKNEWPHNVELEVIPMKKAELINDLYYIEKRDYIPSEIRKDKENKSKYIIQIKDGGYARGFDIRGS